MVPPDVRRSDLTYKKRHCYFNGGIGLKVKFNSIELNSKLNSLDSIGFNPNSICFKSRFVLPTLCLRFKIYSFCGVRCAWELHSNTETRSPQAQIAVLVRGVCANFDIFEDFVELVSMKGTTTGVDILKALLHSTNSMSLDVSKLISVTTDGAPAVIGTNKGTVALL